MNKIIFLFLILHLNQAFCEGVQLDTKLGRIIGFNAKFENYTLDVFYGIPYGEPPIGKLRFKKTNLVKKLKTDPYYANRFTTHCPMCCKDEKVLSAAPISEDCLYMNIWRPSELKLTDEQIKNQNLQIKGSRDNLKTRVNSNLDKDKEIDKLLNLNHSLSVSFDNFLDKIIGTKVIDEKDKKCSKLYPVLIYFYGISGKHHKAKWIAYDGTALSALGQIIVVTVNYRSGPFGNLYVPGEIPANAGLFDQALSIEFVYKHIESFCGDPNLITIFGNSLGSISVGFNLLSSYSNQYFKQAIMQSASPLYNDFIPDTPSQAYKKSFHFASDVNCIKLQEGKKSIDVECLQNLPLEKAQKFMHSLYSFPSLAGDFFNLKSKLLYKTNNVLNIPKDKKILIGLVANEICLGGPEFLFNKQLNDSNPPKVTEKQAQKALLQRLSLMGQSNTKEALEITDFYTSNERIYNNFYYDVFDAFASDVVFNCPVTFFAQSASKRLPGNVFSYVINKKPKTHYLNALPNFNWTGVCHADELVYLFGQSFKNKELFDDSDRLFSRQLIETFSTFIKSGNPGNLTSNKEWLASKKEDLNYVDLDLNKKNVKKFDFEIRCNDLWWKLRNSLDHSLLRQDSPYKLPDKNNLSFFTISFIVIIVLMITIILIEQFFLKKKNYYEKF